MNFYEYPEPDVMRMNKNRTESNTCKDKKIIHPAKQMKFSRKSPKLFFFIFAVHVKQEEEKIFSATFYLLLPILLSLTNNLSIRVFV